MSNTVLLVSKTNDNNSVALVAEALAARGARAFRFDTDKYPTEVQLSLRHPHGRSVLRGADGELVLGDVSSTWYRRVDIGAQLPSDLDKQHRDATLRESRATVFGMLEMLECFMMNRVSAVRGAEHKPRQLEVAARLGLDVPRTLTTNDPAAARAFFTEQDGRVIGKMLSSFAIYDEAGREHVMFTTVLTEDDLAHLDDLALGPMTFQEHLDKRVELRITLIGDRVFAAAVDSQALEGSRTDWRREGMQLLKAWTPYKLADDIADKLIKLNKQLGLVYGAADMIVTPSGRHVFLEVNPGGEWFWLDDVFGPRALSGAIADTLLQR